MGFAASDTDSTLGDGLRPGGDDAEPEILSALLSTPFEEDGSLSAPGYLRVTSPAASGWLPLPEEGSALFRLLPAGEAAEDENIILLTPEGVRMFSANCTNQDCMLQGEVTLENREERVLWNMIICLPHQVMLELFSREEIPSLGLPQP